MRWLFGVAVMLCLVLLVLGRPPQGRARATRGFKNVALSTARGFGKRADDTLLPRMKADWLANEMSESPELAQLFVRRFLDSDSDGFISPDELMGRPATSWLSEHH